MRKMVGNTSYTMEERKDGFIFTIREGDYERSLVIGEITKTAAEKLLMFWLKTKFCPGIFYRSQRITTLRPCLYWPPSKAVLLCCKMLDTI